MEKKRPEELLKLQIESKTGELQSLIKQYTDLLTNPGPGTKDNMTEKHRWYMAREGVLDFLGEFATEQKNVTNFSLYDYWVRANEKYEKAKSHWKYRDSVEKE